MKNTFFDQNEVLSVLQGFNPWWGKATYDVPRWNRLAFDVCLKYLTDLELQRAVFLSGLRRVGKTTILKQIGNYLLPVVEDPKSILYVSLDHPLLKLLPLRKVLQIYHDNIYPEGKRTFLLLDEVQYSGDWELEVKQLIDHKKNYRILTTGSSSTQQSGKLSESGVGRWMKVSIRPLSFYEFLLIRSEPLPDIPNGLRVQGLMGYAPGDLAQLAVKCNPLRPLFARYLLVGGFPETALQKDVSASQRILREDVVERVLKRDMTTLFGVRNVDDLDRLFVYLCLNTGGIFSVQGCAKDLEINQLTVSNYLQVLEQANLIYRLAPTATGGKKVLKAKNKVYLIDAALRNSILLKGDEVLKNDQEMGVIVETAILRHLYAYYFKDTPQMRYWRDPKTGHEVDLIVTTGDSKIPLEVKYRENAALSEKDGIVKFARNHAQDTPYAFWITKNDQDIGIETFPGLGTKFMKIPAHIFAFLVGRGEHSQWAAVPGAGH